MFHIGELLAVFAKSDEDQERYFPELERAVFVSNGEFEYETTLARLIALCALSREAKHLEVVDGEFGRVCTEIAALATLLIEVSSIYEWLVWHPRAVRENDDGSVDRTMYEVWSAMRRLCRQGLQLRPYAQVPRPFADVFSELIAEKDW